MITNEKSASIVLQYLNLARRLSEENKETQSNHQIVLLGWKPAKEDQLTKRHFHFLQLKQISRLEVTYVHQNLYNDTKRFNESNVIISHEPQSCVIKPTF